MSVILCTSKTVPDHQAFFGRITIGTTKVPLSDEIQAPDMAASLERAFDEIAPEWIRLGKQLSAEPTAALAHAPACAANISDLGLMMTWALIVSGLVVKKEAYLIVTDDPWVFRHLAAIDGVSSGKPPPLWTESVKYWFRGLAARTWCSCNLVFQNLKLRHQRKLFGKNEIVLLVYGHPNSTAEGKDGYFSDLLIKHPGTRRALHVDCNANRALELQGADNQTLSLHAWGSLKDALFLPFKKWRPTAGDKSGPYSWLVKRSASKEGGTGQAAMIAWQITCQNRWLETVKPQKVIWPWENHSWERAFVAAASQFATHTVGYQHTVIGRQMLNYSFKSNKDGLNSVPDKVICTGLATKSQLSDWGIPEDRLQIGGALRIPELLPIRSASDGPIYLALSFDEETANQMTQAAANLTHKGYHFLIKSHPMQPYTQPDNSKIVRTDRHFFEHQNLRAVIYAASTVGLEAALAGLPTIRFQTEGKIALDILPDKVILPASDATHLERTIETLEPPKLNRDQIFSPVDPEFWKRTLDCDRPILKSPKI